MDASVIEIRAAEVRDLEALHDLDAVVFGGEGPILEPAATGELESGVHSGILLVAMRDDLLIGFVQLDRVDDDTWFLASLAVASDERLRGVGSRLLDRALESIGRGCTTVSTATSWQNDGMVHLLFSRGFTATGYFADYYGPGKDRLVFDRHRDRLSHSIVDRRLLPAASTTNWQSLLVTDDWVMRRVTVIGGRPYVELVRLVVGDRESLKTEESHAGMGFAGAVIAALTFLLGFSITSDRFTDDVRILLAVAVVASLLSMVVYANAFGELARLQADRFVRRMEVGNIISEYGGIVPLLIIVPVSLMAVVGSETAVWVLGVVGTLVLAAYFSSTISLWKRYRRHWWSPILVGIIAAGPALWIFVADGVVSSVGWTVLTVLALSGATAALYLSPGETDGDC